MTNTELIAKARAILDSEPGAYTVFEAIVCFREVVEALAQTTGEVERGGTG